MHHQELATILLNYHIGRIVLGSMCVGVSVWLGWSGVRVADYHFLCAQHVSDINISIIRSLRLFCWITTLVVLFLVRCVLEFRCARVGVVSVLQAEACNTDTTNSRKLVMMDILMSETCWAHKKLNEMISNIKLIFYSSTITMMHCPINIRLTKDTFITCWPLLNFYAFKFLYPLSAYP